MNPDGPFAESVEFQQKVLAQMLASPSFCDVASSALGPEDFGNKLSQWFYTKMTESKIHFTPVTLKEELLKEARAKTIDEDLVSEYVEMFRVVSQPPVPMEIDYINEHMLSFIRMQACKRAAVDSIDLLKSGDFAEIERRMVEAANAGADIMGQGLDYFGEYQTRIAHRASREKERKLSTGIPELDELTYGGIKTKQLGLCVGGTGRGKSLFLQWLAKVAVLLGKKVVYITCELSAEDMADRFDSLFAHIKPQGLQDHSSLALRSLSQFNKRFGSSLFIKEYTEGEATIYDIKAYLTQLTAKGFMPDLVLVDYVDLLKPHRSYGDLNQEQTIIIQALRGIAKSMDTRVWTACQLNRAGLVMETPDATSIAGGVSRLFTCDIGIFMAQTNEEREDEIMRLILDKNRNGRAGRTIKLDTEYEFLTFYRDPPPKPQDDNDGQGNQTTNTQGDVVSTEKGDVLILQ